MLIYIQTDLFTSPAQTLVNTVNIEGVMGKGIAKTFKDKYPKMFQEYKIICDRQLLSIGNLHLWRGSEKWILNFPTKTTWKKPSELSYIKAGLEKFCSSYEELGIVSISFPPLGCGNGQLDWQKDVKPMMNDYLGKLPIKIYIHEVSVSENFVPEHIEIKSYPIPKSFENFLQDIRTVLYQNKGSFSTLSKSSEFDVSYENEFLKIRKAGKTELIPKAALLMAWSTLQNGVLSVDQFNDTRATRYKSYLFPVLAQLPYVAVTKTSNSLDNSEKYGLLFKLEQKQNKIEQASLWPSQ